MPFYRPTREEIRRRVQGDFIAAFDNSAVLYEGTIEYAFCEAVVGLSHAMHGRLDQIYRDAFPHLASEQGVLNWAALFNIFRNKATYASGEVYFYGTVGAEVPKGTIVARQRDGFEYRTEVAMTLVAEQSENYVRVRARVPGAIGNHKSQINDAMTLQQTLGGVSSFVETRLIGIVGGADAEDIPALRERLLEALAEPSGGGQKGDYIRWAKKVTGVTRAWEYGCVPKIGNVTVLFMRDLDETGPFPDAPERAAVTAMLTLFAPIALPTPIVQSPIDHPLTLEIQLTIEANAVLADVKAAVIKSIQDMLATRASPPATDGTVLYRSWISEAISSTVGEKDHKLIVPAMDEPLSQWHIPTLKTIDVTWS